MCRLQYVALHVHYVDGRVLTLKRSLSSKKHETFSCLFLWVTKHLFYNMIIVYFICSLMLLWRFMELYTMYFEIWTQKLIRSSSTILFIIAFVTDDAFSKGEQFKSYLISILFMYLLYTMLNLTFLKSLNYLFGSC